MFILLVAQEPAAAVVFLEQWSNIWYHGNGNIFNNRYRARRARVTAAAVRDTRFVLSDMDYTLMEYYRYAEARYVDVPYVRDRVTRCKILCVGHCYARNEFLIRSFPIKDRTRARLLVEVIARFSLDGSILFRGKHYKLKH